MSQPVTLTNAQQVVLLTLQNHILPVDNFDPEDVKALRKARMIRVVLEDRLSITGIGLDYLLMRPRTAIIPERNPHEPVAPEQPALPPINAKGLNHYQTEQLRKIASSPVPAKQIHYKTRALLIQRNLVVNSNDGSLYLSDTGRDVVERLAAPLAMSAPEPPASNASEIETKALENREVPANTQQPFANATGTFDENTLQKLSEDCAEDCARCINGRFLNYLYQSIPEARALFERFVAYEHAVQDYEAARDALADATNTLRHS